MDDMTIADLANALAGVLREALVLIDTPDGLKRLRTTEGTRIGERNGKMVRHPEFERYAVILQAER